MRRNLLVVASLAAATPLMAEPHAFGIAKGTTIDKVILFPSPTYDLKLNLRSVPNPHKWLEGYVAFLNHKMELCRIVGSGDLPKHQEFTKVRDQVPHEMQEAYGSPIVSRESIGNMRTDVWTFETPELIATLKQPFN